MKTFGKLALSLTLALGGACRSQGPTEDPRNSNVGESREDTPQRRVCDTRDETRDLFYSIQRINPDDIFSFENDLLNEGNNYDTREAKGQKKTLFEHCLRARAIAYLTGEARRDALMPQPIRVYEEGAEVEDHIEVVREFLMKILSEKNIDIENLSVEESSNYVDMILSRDPYEILIFPALYTMFPNLEPVRRKYILKKFLEEISKNTDFNFYETMPNAMELARSDEEKEMIARYLIEHGSDLDVEYLKREYPKHYKKITGGVDPEKSGYLRVFGSEVTISKAEWSGEVVNVIVHPFYDVIDVKFFEGVDSAEELEDRMVTLKEMGVENRAAEIYQEYEHMKTLVENGEPILFVLPRFSKKDERKGSNKMSYAKLLKDILGEHDNYHIIESESDVSGGLVDYDKKKIEGFPGGKTAEFSGGFVGACLKVAKDDFRALGFKILHNIPASTLNGYYPYIRNGVDEEAGQKDYDKLVRYFLGIQEEVRARDQMTLGEILRMSPTYKTDEFVGLHESITEDAC